MQHAAGARSFFRANIMNAYVYDNMRWLDPNSARCTKSKTPSATREFKMVHLTHMRHVITVEQIYWCPRGRKMIEMNNNSTVRRRPAYLRHGVESLGIENGYIRVFITLFVYGFYKFDLI